MLGDGTFTSKDTELLKNSQFIDVDAAESRDSIQEYLAARHIDGIKQWKPEAKRRFYAKQYMSRKAITQVLKMTPETKTTVTKYIREYIFLQDFKTRAGFDYIKEPSIIYERIYFRFIDLGILDAIEIAEDYKLIKIHYKYDYINKKQLGIFIKEIGKATITNKDIKSRTINKKSDFTLLMKNIDFRIKYPTLVSIYDDIEKETNSAEYKPKQKVIQKFVDNPMSIENIIDYSGLTTVPNIKIEDENATIIDDITNAPVGTSYGERLPPFMETQPYTQYRY